MKKIVHITYENVFRNGILIAMVLKPAIAIAEKYKVNIIITSAIKDGEDDDIYKSNKNNLKSAYVKVIEFKKTISKTQSINSFLNDVSNQIKFLSKEIRLTDIIHARGYGGAFIAAYLKFRFGFKWIFDIRGTLPEETVDVGKIKKFSFKFLLLKSAEFFFLKFSNEVIAVSNKMKIHFNKYTSKKISVIRNPATFSEYPKRTKRNTTPLNIVYLGSFQNWHLPNETIKIIKDLSYISKIPIKVTVITGDKFLANTYFKHIKINGSIEIKSMSYSLIPNELSKNDIGFCLIKPTFSKSVCMPVKFNEYLAAGVYVVVNKNIGDLEEITNGSNGIVLDDPNNTENAKLIWEKYSSKIDFEKIPEDLFWDKKGLSNLVELYNL